MSNGDAFTQSSYLGNSVDFGKMNMSRAAQATIAALDKHGDDFRFKKNFTNNAGRILDKNSTISYTPGQLGSAKYNEMKKDLLNPFGGAPSKDDSFGSAKGKTFGQIGGKENFNQSNIQKQSIAKPFMKEPAGGYNAASIKRSLGYHPTADFDVDVKAGLSSGYNTKPSVKIGQNLTQAGLNDPSFHRTKNLNNYGFDVLTGVRKESPNRSL